LAELKLFKYIIELTLPPLFWIYVRELTSEHSRGWRKTDLWHFALPLLPILFLAIILCYFAKGLDGVFTDNGSVFFINKLNAVLNISAVAQFAVYVLFIMNRLASYRRKLANLFASTTHLELAWFRQALLIIIFCFLLELSIELLNAMHDIANPYTPWDGVLRLIVVWFFSVWGLRQKPGLRIEINKTNESTPNDEKYQSSTLTPIQLKDVASKIRNQLEVEKGYCEPKLSLRILSKRINVLPNYVSQALNVEIKESFFDYVNRLRVMEAIELLKNSNKTVSNISSDVGFNSRSSFYSAFKKLTGLTPSAYRNHNLNN
jgi:AraC-like DNA-binding protein